MSRFTSVDIEFIQPSPALARHFSVYYRIRDAGRKVEDQDRADVGYVRFMLKGQGKIDFSDGKVRPAHPVMILGPATATSIYRVDGPLDCFGCVMLPDFWGGIVDNDATEAANDSIDGTQMLGADAEDLRERLASCETLEEMAQEADRFFVRRIRPIADDQCAVIDRIGDWLRCFPIPSPEALYAAADRSDRQVMRLANRHFGAPPAMLARKYRALRTASRLLGVRGTIPQELIDEYSDRAHMSREIKHFVGLTPRQLQVNVHPILRVTLHPSNFSAEAPWT